MNLSRMTLVAAFLLVSPGHGTQPTHAGWQEAEKAAEARLDDGLPGTEPFVAVFVRMEDQLFPAGGDYERFCEAAGDGAERLKLRSEVVATLKGLAQRSHGRWQGAVERLTEAGEVRGVQRYWIVNGFACEASPDGCRALAELAGVGFVYRQRYAPQHERVGAKPASADADAAKLHRELMKEGREDKGEPFDVEGIEIPWNLRAIRADRAWLDHGVTGNGVVVALLDDGMMAVPTLLPALWRNEGETLNGEDDDGNGLVDDVFGYDFRRNSPYTVTTSGHRHGTLCASVVAARPSLDDEPLVAGVAPRATVMPLVGTGQLLAYEYALDKGADILSMSYTFEPVEMGHYRGLFRMAHEHLAAAGIFSVGGAGNYATKRPAGTQVGSPKDVPCVVAAAGVGPDLKVTSFSSRGPISWEGIRYYGEEDEAGNVAGKPDVTACNAGFPMWTRLEVWTGARADRLEKVIREDAKGYLLAVGPRGNSFAGPHAAGVAALMLEANPDLPVWRLQHLMESTCEDMGEPGRDAVHGMGLLRADDAVEAALVLR